jgi:ferredoxin
LILVPIPSNSIKVTFRESSGKDIRTVECNEGDDLLSVAHEYDIDLEGTPSSLVPPTSPPGCLRPSTDPSSLDIFDRTGACEGSVACSTCHVVLSPEMYDALPEPSDEENDMLDLAFGLTDTYGLALCLLYISVHPRADHHLLALRISSRLGCQVHITKDVDGLVATLPSATRNMFVDVRRSLVDGFLVRGRHADGSIVSFARAGSQADEALDVFVS